MLMVTLAHDRRHDLALRHRAEGIFPDRRHRLRARHHRRRHRYRRSRRWSSAAAQGRRHRARGSGGRLRQFDRRRRRPQFAAGNSGRMLVALKPQRRARQARSDRHRAAAARTPMSSPAWRSSSSRSRTSISAASCRRANINTRCNRTTPTTLYRMAPELRDKIAKLPGLRDVTTDLYIKNPQVTIDVDREKAAVYGVTRRSGAPGALQRLRHAPGRDHLYAGERLSGHPRDRAGISQRARAI